MALLMSLRALGSSKTLTAGCKMLSRLPSLALLLLISAGVGNAASWTKLNNLAPSSVQLMIQMTDGTILVQSQTPPAERVA